MKYLIFTLLTVSAIAKPPAKLIKYAQSGYQYAKAHNITQSPLIIIVDFSQASNSKRLWLYDLKHNKTILESYVAHGKGTGLTYSEKFSNDSRSHQSSLGFYKILEPYNGKHGLSLKLDGLEPTNKSALKRGIVIHTANYVTPKYISEHNRAGRSWGCFAVPKDIEQKLIEKTKDHSLVMAYYPDTKWLKSSKFLK